MKNLFQFIPLLIAVVNSATGADEVVYAVVGQTATLTPPDSNGRYLYWFFTNKNYQIANLNPLSSSWSYSQDESWKNRVSVSNAALTITNLNEDDFQTFTFSKLVGHTTVAVQTFKLSKITVNTKSHLLLPGESLNLNCDVETVNSRKPEVNWLSPGGKTYEGRATEKVTSEHNGDWTCVVKQGVKEYKATVSVTVVDLSPSLSHPQYTSQNETLTIPCSLPSYVTWEQIKTKGLQEVHWQFFPKTSLGSDPQKLFSLSLHPLQWKEVQPKGLNPVPDVSKGIFSLTRSKGKPDDRGHYVCTFEFENGKTLTRTVHVEVLQVIPIPETSLTSGDQLSLTCGIGRVLPSDLHLKWFPPKPSAHAFLKHPSQPTNFTIVVSTTDNGVWRCELWQDTKKLTSQTICLNIKPKLSVWMLVIICSAAVIVVLLLVLVYILLRRRQRKMRHPRHRLCQCTNPMPKGFYKT